MKWTLKLLPCVASLVLIASCGGSNDPTTTGTISSLSDVPSAVLNPQEYDLTTQSALSAQTVKSSSVTKEGQGSASFSRAGCETNVMKKNIIRNALMPRMILCQVKAFESASGGTAAGNGVFNYWRLPAPPSGEGENGPPGVDIFSPRVAMKLDGNVFTFVMCNGTTKSMELNIDSSNNIYRGHVVNKWGDGFSGKLEFNADGLPPASFTTASFTQSFVEQSSYFNGYGSATLVATPTYNIIHGFNSGTAPNNGGTFSGATYAKFNKTEGTAKYRMDSGSFPGQTVEQAFERCPGCPGSAEDWIAPGTGWLSACGLGELTTQSVICFQKGEMCPVLADENGLCSISTGSTFTESFTINSTSPLALIFTEALTSIFAADVAEVDAPSTGTQPTIEFTSASADVDCTTSDTWTQLTFTRPPDIFSCMEMEQEMNEWESGEVCANQEAKKEAEDGPPDS